MKGVNNKDHLQIFINNNPIANIIVNNENLFAFKTVSTNNIVSKNFIYNIDTNLRHARLRHYYNDIIKILLLNIQKITITKTAINMQNH